MRDNEVSMNLSNVIAQECCLILNESTKTEVLIEMMESIAGAGYVKDLESLKKEIFYREQLMSTGIGMGIGIPHVRFKGIENPVVAVGIKPEGVKDYESIDNEDVKIIFMILVGEDQHKEHIRLLSQIMEKLRNQKDRELLSSMTDGKDIYAFLTGGESHE